MSKKKKITAINQKEQKHIPNQPASVDGKPHFRFEKIDKNGKFRFDINREDFNATDFLDKMIHYSSMNWCQIYKQTHDSGKSKHHYLTPYERLSLEARNRLIAMQLEDFSDSIFSFAFNNTTRIVGIREKDNFYVLWYDARHEIYPSNKRNT